ncbi:hypothetical protein Hanom_Chr02g00162631 [Helianthus anomalus]
MIRGFTIFRFIFPGTTTSLLNITPLRTLESSNWPPGIFSTFMYFLISTSRKPWPRSTPTVVVASSARS